jgi:hypothetical protein
VTAVQLWLAACSFRFRHHHQPLGSGICQSDDPDQQEQSEQRSLGTRIIIIHISFPATASFLSTHTICRKDALGGSFSWNLILLEHRSRSIDHPRTWGAPLSAPTPKSSSASYFNLVFFVIGVHRERLGVESLPVRQSEEIPDTRLDAECARFEDLPQRSEHTHALAGRDVAVSVDIDVWAGVSVGVVIWEREEQANKDGAWTLERYRA